MLLPSRSLLRWRENVGQKQLAKGEFNSDEPFVESDCLCLPEYWVYRWQGVGFVWLFLLRQMWRGRHR